MCTAIRAQADDAVDAIAALERHHGGRLGVFAVDTGTGRTLMHRPDERFLMCSTFKMLAAGFVLQRADAGAEQLDRMVRFSPSDLLGHAPVTRAQLGIGAMSVGALCEAAITVSDNGAANLLLGSFGGPLALTQFLRGIGDGITRLDRNEPALNEPAGELDTTSPRAMAATTRALLLGTVLSAISRGRLNGWMLATSTGLHRLRAGMPGDWQVGDKTGTGNAQTNDVAILRPPNRAPLIVAAFFETLQLGDAAREAVVRDVGVAVTKCLRSAR